MCEPHPKLLHPFQTDLSPASSPDSLHPFSWNTALYPLYIPKKVLQFSINNAIGSSALLEGESRCMPQTPLECTPAFHFCCPWQFLKPINLLTKIPNLVSSFCTKMTGIWAFTTICWNCFAPLCIHRPQLSYQALFNSLDQRIDLHLPS